MMAANSVLKEVNSAAVKSNNPRIALPKATPRSLQVAAFMRAVKPSTARLFCERMPLATVPIRLKPPEKESVLSTRMSITFVVWQLTFRFENWIRNDGAAYISSKM